MNNKRAVIVCSVFIFCLYIWVTPVYSDEKRSLGEGATLLPTTFQGKAYCSLTYPVATNFRGDVVEKLAKVGDYVKSGDVLMKVALQPTDLRNLEVRTDLRLHIRQAELDLASYSRSLKILEKKRDEILHLLREGMAPAQTVKEIEEEISFLQLQINRARDQLAKSMQDIKKEVALVSDLVGQKVSPGQIPKLAFVRAPTSGYIIWENANIQVSALAVGHLFTIGVMDPMIIRTQVYEADAARLRPGDEAEVVLDFDGGKILQATLKTISWVPISAGIDSPSYYTADLEIPNPDNVLKEGYKVRVMFPVKASKEKARD